MRRGLSGQNQHLLMDRGLRLTPCRPQAPQQAKDTEPIISSVPFEMPPEDQDAGRGGVGHGRAGAPGPGTTDKNPDKHDPAQHRQAWPWALPLRRTLEATARCCPGSSRHLLQRSGHPDTTPRPQSLWMGAPAALPSAPILFVPSDHAQQLTTGRHAGAQGPAAAAGNAGQESRRPGQGWPATTASPSRPRLLRRQLPRRTFPKSFLLVPRKDSGEFQLTAVSMKPRGCGPSGRENSNLPGSRGKSGRRKTARTGSPRPATSRRAGLRLPALVHACARRRVAHLPSSSAPRGHRRGALRVYFHSSPSGLCVTARMVSTERAWISLWTSSMLLEASTICSHRGGREREDG